MERLCATNSASLHQNGSVYYSLSTFKNKSLKKEKRISYRENLIALIEGNVIQKEINVGAVKTAYLTLGTGMPVVFLHGAGAGAVSWYATLGVVAKNYQVIAPDIIGYGESDKPEATYTRAYFAKWLKDFLVELGIDKAHIVGLSQGGAIAMQFARDYPERVEKLILVNAGGLGAQVSFGALLGVLWMNNFPSEIADKFNSKYILFNPLKRDRNHSLYSIAVIKCKGGKNVFRFGKGAAVSKIPDHDLKQIQPKTLLIWGNNDKLFAVTSGENAVKLIPNAKLHKIPDAGHLPLIDQPELFNEALLEFLKVD